MMKQPYAESTVKKKLRETGIPKPVLDKLHLYCTACANFYKAISIDEVWKVIRRSERNYGKIEAKDFLSRDLMENIRIYLVDEFQRHLQDELIDRADDNTGPSKEEMLYEVIRREEKYDKSEKRRLLKTAETLWTPLTRENDHYVEGSYELTREDFNKYIAVRERSCDRYFVIPEDELYEDGDPKKYYLVDIPAVMDFEDMEIVGMSYDKVYEILGESADKPLCVPEDLYNYINITYYERTPQTDAMEAFLERTFFADQDMEDEETEVDFNIMMTDLHRIIIRAANDPIGDFQLAINSLEDKGYYFSGSDQVQQFVQLFMDMSNHTRQPANKGETPDNLYLKNSKDLKNNRGMPKSISFGPGIQNLLRSGEWDAAEMKQTIMTQGDWPMDFRANMIREVDRALEPGEEKVVNESGTIVKGRKIKPNEPCPCGSGRKYKHCCGKKN